jgi:peptide-methionine (S)-S-oxide reductase
MNEIVLGGGCFWCLEAIFTNLRGVEEVESGYAGGERANPTSEQVYSGATGHAEVVRVRFDESQLPLATLLKLFFTLHDPTTLNRQGNDIGTQYRSVIFTSTPEQREVAQQVLEEIAESGIWEDDIVTELAQLDTFYPAEAYHQRYFAKNPESGYCRVIIQPKVAKLRREFSSLLE